MASQVAQDFEAAAPNREFTVEDLQQRGDGYDGGSSEYENEGTMLMDNSSQISYEEDAAAAEAEAAVEVPADVPQ